MNEREVRRNGTWKPTAWLGLVLAGALLTSVCGVFGAASDLEPGSFDIVEQDGTYSLRANEANLYDVMAGLRDRVGITFRIDPLLRERTVTIDLEAQALDDLVRKVSDGYALTYVRDGNEIRLTAASVASSQEAAALPTADEGPRQDGTSIRTAALRDMQANGARPGDLGILSNTDRSIRELRVQAGPPAILMENAILDIDRLHETGQGLDIPNRFRASEDTEYFIVQFDRPLSSAIKADIESAGARVTHYVPKNAYAVRIPTDARPSVEALPGVTHIEPYHPYLKMSKDILMYMRGVPTAQSTERTQAGQYNLMMFGGVDGAAALADLDVEIRQTQHSRDRQVLTVTARPDLIESLIHVDGVQWIEPDLPRMPMNDLAGDTVRASTFRKIHSTLDGSGVIVGVTDSGVDTKHRGYAIDPNLPTDIGINSRIIDYQARPGGLEDGIIGDMEGHGTHVSATVLGNGALSDTAVSVPGSGSAPYDTFQFAGIAPEAQLVMIEDFVSFTHAEQAEITYTNGARISNNSWGNDLYQYGTQSAIWDGLVRDASSNLVGNQELIAVFAAGNAGNGQTDGLGGTANTIGEPGNAKNVITVGAIEQERKADNLQTFGSLLETDTDWQVADSSSRGPIGGNDQRVKPDIVAPGVYVISAQSRDTDPDSFEDPLLISTDLRNNNVDTGTNYAFLSGTSMATPVVAGSAALVLEHLKENLGITDPSPALVKAMLIHGAQNLNSLVYQYPSLGAAPGLVLQGWGKLDVVRSVDGPLIQPTDEIHFLDQGDNNPVETGQTNSIPITIKAGEGGIKITLVWTDPPGTPGSGATLVNDLHLGLRAADGSGWIGNFYRADGLHSVRIVPEISYLAADVLNNVENIIVPDLLPGNYTIEVVGGNVTDGPQDYALVYTKGQPIVSRNIGLTPDMDLTDDDEPVIAYSLANTATAIGPSTNIYVRAWKGSVPLFDADLDTWTRMEGQWFDVAGSSLNNGVSATPDPSVNPSVAVDGDNIYVAWEQLTSSTNDPTTIYLKMFNGTSWVELGNSGRGLGISQNTVWDALDPVVGVAADGYPVVAWQQAESGGAKIFLKKWDGSAWVSLGSSATTGIPGSVTSSRADIATDSLGRIVVAWNEVSNFRIRVRRWTGTTWQTIPDVGFAPFALNSTVAIDSSDRIVVAYLQLPGNFPGVSLSQIFVARFTGASWQSIDGSYTGDGISDSVSGATSPLEPSIDINDADEIGISWLRTGGVSNSVFVVENKGSGWNGVAGADMIPGVDNLGGTSLYAVAKMDSLGIPVVSFQNNEQNIPEAVAYTVAKDRAPPIFPGLSSAIGGGANNVTLTWAPAFDASEPITYTIYRANGTFPCGTTPTCTAGNVFANPIATTTSTSFNVPGLVNGQVYCFGVRAADSTGLQEKNTVIRSAGPITGTGDPDNDCIVNSVELAIGTDVCIPDTDGDGMWDGWEWAFSTNNPSHTNSLALDPLDNGFEKINTIIPNDGDPKQLGDADLDGDGASNREEFEWWRDNTGADCSVVSGAPGPSPDPTEWDTDGDGIPDGWEIINGLNPTDPADAAGDLDLDGLDNLGEYLEGGDPGNPDSDGDGLGDGEEFNTYGTRVNLADSDGDGLDDKAELDLGTDPTDWDTTGNGLSDGDMVQLGFDDPSDPAITNLTILGTWDFETVGQQNAWTHEAPNPAAPFDLWHVSTADPDPFSSQDGIQEVNERSTNTAYRLAYDPTGSDTNATYNFAGLKIISDLISPAVDATLSTTLLVSWNEYVNTEAAQDLTRVFVIGCGQVTPVPVTDAVSGIGPGWVHRTADLSACAGFSDVQVLFRFQTLNSINQDFPGWYVDDVTIFEGNTLSGWVRDENGRPIVQATVLAMGRGGVTNVVSGHTIVAPGKIFGSARTADDGSYVINGLPRGEYYVKADSPFHRAEFWNGPLFSGSYGFGNGLNPGVPERESVATVVDLTGMGASAEARFELSPGVGRGSLGVGASAAYDVEVNDLVATFWNGDNSTNTSAFIPYQTDPANTFSNRLPDWISNPVQPNLLSDLLEGPHLPYALGTGVLYPRPTLDVREGETTTIVLGTDQAEGRIFVTAADGGAHPIFIDGQNTGEVTPANIVIKAGAHVVRLSPTGGAKWVAQKFATVPIGARVPVAFSVNDLTGDTGSLTVSAVDIYGTPLIGGDVYVDGILITGADIAQGQTPGTPTTIVGLQPGSHAVTVQLDGYMTHSYRTVNVAPNTTISTLFALYQSDRDYDQVGDGIEVAGYGDVFLYSRDDDPDADGLSNREEFNLFEFFGIALDIFDADSDDDGMTDGEEVGYDGNLGAFALSELDEVAAIQDNSVSVLFVGSYLAGDDFFFDGGGNFASIDCDQFEYASRIQSEPMVPTIEPASTVFIGVPATGEASRVSIGHPVGTLVYADTLPDEVDTDGDGMWDGFENTYAASANLSPIECSAIDDDPDADGLSNLEEFLGPDGIANTNDMLNPANPDSDGDWMPDGFEMNMGLDASDPTDGLLDPDGDGLANVGEYFFASNPFLADTDGDFLPDGAELDYGSNPNMVDTDGDGLIDGREVWDRDLDGIFDGGFFNIFPGSDFDGDGFPDGPLDWDTDGDGMPDGFEVLDPSFGLPYDYTGLTCVLDPLNATDADLDCDEDGLSNLEEYLVRDALFGNSPFSFDPGGSMFDPVEGVWAYSTDPFKADTDEDGIPDGFEVYNGLHPQDPAPVFQPIPLPDETNRVEQSYELSAKGDLDHDGLWNLREYNIRFFLDETASITDPVSLSTHPWDPDTDKDGLGDGEEDRLHRTNPLNQDTDGDRLMDGVATADTYGEIDSTFRFDTSTPPSPNQYDGPTNDLWVLTFQPDIDANNEDEEDYLPYWFRIDLPAGATVPEPRWGAAAVYNPVLLLGGDDSDVILLNNRQLIVIGGQDGVSRHRDIWQFRFGSNTVDSISELNWVESTNLGAGVNAATPVNSEWFRVINSAAGSNLLDSSYASGGGLSDVSAFNVFGYRNTGVSNNVRPGSSSDVTPGGTDRTFDWTYVFGGWGNSHKYYGSEIIPFYKSEDPVYLYHDDFTVSNNAYDVLSGSNIVAASTNLIAIASGDDDGGGTAAGVFFGVGDAPPVASVTSNDVNILQAAHFRFDFTGSSNAVVFCDNCVKLCSAELILPIDTPVTANFDLQIVLEVSESDGNSAEEYNPESTNSPSDRITDTNIFANSIPVLTNITAGFTGDFTIDIRDAWVSLWNVTTNYTGENLGIVITATGPDGIVVVANLSARLVVDWYPSYLVAPDRYGCVPAADNFAGGFEPFFESTDNRDISLPGGGNWNNFNLAPLIRKSSPIAYDYRRQIALMYGGIDGNNVLGDTLEGTFEWDPQIGEPPGEPFSLHSDRVTWDVVNTSSNAAIPEARYAHSLVYDDANTRFVLFGGFNADHKPLNDLWTYAPEADTWTEITEFRDSSRPAPRGGASMIYFGDYDYSRGDGATGDDGYNSATNPRRIVLFGGTDGKQYFNDTWLLNERYNPEWVNFGSTNRYRWRLVTPNGEHSLGPSPRAYASFVYGQNALKADLGILDANMWGAGILFGGRVGVLPTATDTDGDRVPDGLEHELGGPAAGRDPRVNRLYRSAWETAETIPYAYKPIGAPATVTSVNPVDSTITIEPFFDVRGFVSDFETLSFEEWDSLPVIGFGQPVQGSPVEGTLNTTSALWRTGVDALVPQHINLWWHRFGGEQPGDPRDEWQLGTPDPSIIGEVGVPPYAYRGRWGYGTDNDGVYANDAIMELYSPVLDLSLPSNNSTTPGLTTSWYLMFYEWLDLNDMNDNVRLDLIRPATDADVLSRSSGTGKPPVPLIGARNDAFNTQGEWRQQVIPLDVVAGETNAYLRFTLQSDSTGSAGGWYIDEVAVFQASQISGLVTSNGVGVSSALVQLVGTNANQNVIASTMTDPNGRYQFGPLPFGSYRVLANGGGMNVVLSETENAPGDVNFSGADFWIVGFALSSSFEITWSAVPGATYRVEYADSLTPEPVTWTTLTSVVAGSAVESYTDNSAEPLRLYRVVME